MYQNLKHAPKSKTLYLKPKEKFQEKNICFCACEMKVGYGN
jgi:hypothetical protein